MPLKTLLIIVLGLAFLYGLFTVGAPFLLALVVVLFMEPLTRLLIKYGRMNRLAAGLVSSTVFTVALLGAIYLLGLRLFSELLTFFENAGDYIDKVSKYITNTTAKTQLFYETLPVDQAQQIQDWVQNGVQALTSAAQNLVSGIGHSLFNFAVKIPNMFIFFIVFLVAIYLFSFSLDILKKGFLSIFEEDSRGKVDMVLGNLRGSIFGFLKAQIILSTITFVLTFIGLFILGVEHAVAIAFLVTLVDILPILGTGSFLVPWAVFNAVNDDWFLAIGLVVLFLAITVIRKIVEPKVLGDSVGIGALSALISLYVGFKLVGVIGMFLGPIVVIVYMAMRKEGLLNIKIKLE